MVPRTTALEVDHPKVDDSDLRFFFHGIAKPQLRKFGGAVDQYHTWREQFEIFVNHARIPSRHKMMMLKNCLAGRPLQLVERLGYTDKQYLLALEKLDQRYGGETRLLQHYLDSIISMPVIKEGDLKGLDEFSSILCDIVAKLSESGTNGELRGASALYTIVQQKMPTALLLLYRNLVLPPNDEGILHFTNWLNRQVNIRFELADQKDVKRSGLSSVRKPERSSANLTIGSAMDVKSNDGKKANGKQSFQFTRPVSPADDSKLTCAVCHEKHTLRDCEKWEDLSVAERWQFAKNNRQKLRREWMLEETSSQFA
ncbi:Uncharacterised protein r2_g3609 [Pycnogonum litorale]